MSGEIRVKMPVLLDEHLGDAEILYPTKGSLKLEMNGASEASLTVPGDSSVIPMHGWVKIYNQLGFVGIFRRISRDNNVTVDQTCVLKHGIDILHDSAWAAQTDFTGNMTQFLTALLDQQTALIQGPGDSAPRKPWVLGSCEDSSSVSKSINYDNLLDLLNGVTEDGGDYYFTYNQTVWPWTVSLVEKPSDVASEFRLSRNIEKCKIRDNDSELCTRLILNVNAMEDDTGLANDTGVTVKQNNSGIRVYNNTTAQAAYGIIVKTTDIDIAGTIPADPSAACPEADAFAADFLARRAAPQLQIQIDGYVLKRITGEDWDESKIANVCRASLESYPAPIDERVVSIQYPDLYATPDKVSVSMANALPTLTKSFSSAQKSVDKIQSENRGTARAVESLDRHFEITDNSGKVLKQAGMKLDANGALIYATDGENMVGSKFSVQADKIGMVVGTNQDGNYIKAGEICLSINNSGDSQAVINASKIYLLGQTIADTVTADYISGKISTMTALSTINLTVTGELYVRNSANQSTSIRTCYAGVSMSESGGQVTLTFTRLNGDSYSSDSVTFSRAVDPTLNWSYQGAISTSSSDPGSAAKSYTMSKGYKYGRFWVDVNGTKKYIKIELTS